jgi:hypothetical protein
MNELPLRGVVQPGEFASLGGTLEASYHDVKSVLSRGMSPDYVETGATASSLTCKCGAVPSGPLSTLPFDCATSAYSVAQERKGLQWKSGDFW